MKVIRQRRKGFILRLDTIGIPKIVSSNVSPYRFGRLCQQRGIPEDRKWFTTQDIFDLSADYQLYKIFQSLPEEKLSLLEKLLRETVPDAFPKK